MEASAFEGVDLFSALTADERAKVAGAMKEVRYPVGGVLVEEGDLPTTFVVVLEGHVTVHRAGRHLADLGSGDFVGEAVVGLDPRNATVIATTPVRAAVLMGWTLRDLLDDLPALATAIDEVRSARSGDA